MNKGKFILCLIIYSSNIIACHDLFGAELYTANDRIAKWIKALSPELQSKIVPLLNSRSNYQLMPLGIKSSFSSNAILKSDSIEGIPDSRAMTIKQLSSISVFHQSFLHRIEQVVDSNRPTPAPCPVSCSSKLVTKMCDDHLSTTDIIASKFINKFKNKLESIAEIEIEAPTDKKFSPIATAFALGDGWIATNYHVIATFTDGRYPKATILPNIAIRLVFDKTIDHAVHPNTINLTADTVIISSPFPDVALMYVPSAKNIPSIMNSEGNDELPTSHESIAIIGFPQNSLEDSTSNATYNSVFGLCNITTQDSVMRIAVGTVVSDSPELEYDVNTLGSNSGSPIFRINDGKLVGMHSGYSQTSPLNHGIPIGAIDNLLHQAVLMTRITNNAIGGG